MADEKLEETYARLAYEIRIYRKQLAILQKEIEKVTLTSLDLMNATRTLESLKTGENLIPLGGGSYVRGEIKDKIVLVPVGAGYLTEINAPAAAERMRRRVDMTKTAIKKLTEEFGRISGTLEVSSRRLKEIEKKIVIDKRVEESVSEDYR
jgi:prefoldin alpha subunit